MGALRVCRLGQVEDGLGLGLRPARIGGADSHPARAAVAPRPRPGQGDPPPSLRAVPVCFPRCSRLSRTSPLSISPLTASRNTLGAAMAGAPVAVATDGAAQRPNFLGSGLRFSSLGSRSAKSPQNHPKIALKSPQNVATPPLEPPAPPAQLSLCGSYPLPSAAEPARRCPVILARHVSRTLFIIIII